MGFKRKANSDKPSGANSIEVTKRAKQDDAPTQAVARKNLLVDSDSDSEVEVAPVDTGFKVNEEFAKRFEYNKKREELSRLEEKFNDEKKKTLAKGQYGDKYDDDEDSSSDEDEDDEGFLVTEDLDQEISATLAALRNKDPRVYDEKVTFYAPMEDTLPKGDKEKVEKPMYLQDYHRENLLKQANGEDFDMGEAPPMTFAEEQEKLKKQVLKEMHDAGSDASEDEDGGFLIPKSKPVEIAAKPETSAVHPSRKRKINVDVKAADKDPETFLSNFMSARAWVSGEGTKWEAMESEDEDEVQRADQYEAAYNLRFEDPTKSNEVLKSYARDIIAEKSVRREEPKARKKARDEKREKKELERKQHEDEKARLRKLKIEQMEDKLAKIKKAAGLSGKHLKDEDWAKFLDEGWDDATWEAEMNKKFGEDYYAEPEAGSGSDDEETAASKKKKVKKPKWDDDIDINDIIPDFVEELDENDKGAFKLDSDDEAEAEGEEAEEDDEEEEAAGGKKKKSSKDRKSELQSKKKAARIERKKIEELVDAKLDVDHAILPTKSKAKAVFRYRETSPMSFGLNSRDILMAPDTALNAFVGLKKMASFRDAEKKRKDKKRLGKKARLREWRKETFGNENGPEIVVGEFAPGMEPKSDGTNIIEGKKKKKRSRKVKTAEEILDL